MADNNLSAIRAQIKTDVDAVSAVQASAHGHTQQYTGFPFVKIWFDGCAPELVDTAKGNKRIYRYNLEVVQDSAVKARATAEENWQDAIQALLDKFQDKWTLTNNADLVVARDVTVVFGDSGQGTQLSAIIPLEVTVYTDV